MRLTTSAAAAGFNVSAAVFLGLSAYGIFSFLDPTDPQIPAASLSYLFGAGIGASIAGICYFGIRWDRGKAEDAARAVAQPAKSGGKRKS